MVIVHNTGRKLVVTDQDRFVYSFIYISFPRIVRHPTEYRPLLDWSFSDLLYYLLNSNVCVRN